MHSSLVAMQKRLMPYGMSPFFAGFLRLRVCSAVHPTLSGEPEYIFFARLDAGVQSGNVLRQSGRSERLTIRGRTIWFA
jgi:hypothetical protein